ncbi:MAG TPA: PAS domain-containing protein [Gammaproteobacteria bacterium]|nr:PAS domain-containing protein [Gammaproteobacteria bacterium]
MGRRQDEKDIRGNSELLRLALDTSELGAWQLDLVAHTVKSTPAGKAHFGLPPDTEPSFEQLLERIHRDDRERVRDAIREAFEHDRHYQVEYRTLSPDGSIRWISARGRVHVDASGRRPVGIVSVTNDITSRKMAEQSLRDVRKRLARSMEFGQVGTFTIEWPTKCVYADPYIVKLFSVPPEDEHGGPLEHFSNSIHPDDRARVAATIENAFVTGEYHEVEYRIVQPDGSIFWVNVRSKAEYADNGEPLRLAGILLDINARKRAEEALHASEEKLRLATQAVGIGIFDNDYDRDGDLTRTRLNWSAECKALFGLDADAEIDYYAFMSRLHPEDRNKVEHAVMHALGPGGDGTFQIDYRVIWPDGSLHWLESRGVFQFSGEGKNRYAVSALGAVVDISAHKQANETRMRQQEVDRFLNETSVVLASSLNYDKTLARVARLCVPRLGDWAIADLIEGDDEIRRSEVVSANPARSALAREIKHEPPPKNMFERSAVRALMAGEPLLIPDLAAALQEPETGDNRRIHQLRQLLGEHRGSLLSVPLTARGETLGFLTLINAESRRQFSRGDIAVISELGRRAGTAIDNARLYRQTEEANAALRKQAEALALADRRKDEFLAVLAHELRNPLAPLATNLQLLRRAHGDAGVTQKAHAVMERQLAHLVRLIDDLLDVSRLTRGRISLRKQRVALAELLNDAVEACRNAIAAKSHELSVRLPNEPLYLDADTTRLTQVFTNLLDNAAKYTPPGGHIGIDAEGAGNEVIVKVSDTGIGIRREKLAEIFEMFVQADSPLQTLGGGLGIGLGLTRSLVEMHGGTIEAQSAGRDQGAQMIVRLPLAAAPPAAIAAPPREHRPDSKAAAPRRVLVVDDNHDVADSLSLLLNLMDKEVRTAYDGATAIETAAEFQPDIVFLDIGMPGLNGYETARRIRAERWGENMRLIALTGWGQKEDRRRSQEAGFDLHLVKPLDPAMLEKIVGSERVPA